VDASLDNGLTYYYKVTALNSVGEGVMSNEAFATPVAVPDAPTGLQVTPDNAQVALSWNIPNDNGMDIDYYIVYRDGVDIDHPTGNSYLDTGLSNGATYTYEVAAHNIIGLGPKSAAVQAIPFTVPGAPMDVQVTAGDSQVNLTWSAPNDDGGSDLDHYVVYRNGEDIAHVTTTYLTDTGLTNGVEFTYTVAAHNAAGLGPTSLEVTTTTFGLPGLPTGFDADGGSDYVVLTWGPAEANGAIVDYYIVFRNDVDIAHVSGTSYNDTGLDIDVTYTYAVAAHNAAGTGTLSPSIGITLSRVPSPPLDLQATPGDGNILLTWSVPDYVGIWTLTYHLFRDGTEVWSGAETNYLDDNLTKGALHSYTVAASNSIGWGENSTAVEAAALGVPDAPSSLTAEGLDGEVTLSWTAPVYTGPGIITYHLFRDGIEVWSGTALTYVDTDAITNGETYLYAVAASNSVGWGENSTAASAMPSSTDTGDGGDSMLIIVFGLVVALMVAVAVVLYLRKR
jgi:titin